MKKVFVVPGSGRIVPDHERGDVLPEAGRYVPKTQYWMRRLADGDVVKKPAPKKPAATKSKEA